VDFGTISLNPHASKVLLKILAGRPERKADLFLGRDQHGFRSGCGLYTRDATIAAMRVLCESTITRLLFVLLIMKMYTFDPIDWVKLLDISR